MVGIFYANTQFGFLFIYFLEHTETMVPPANDYVINNVLETEKQIGNKIIKFILINSIIVHQISFKNKT